MWVQPPSSNFFPCKSSLTFFLNLFRHQWIQDILLIVIVKTESNMACKYLLAVCRYCPTLIVSLRHDAAETNGFTRARRSEAGHGIREENQIARRILKPTKANLYPINAEVKNDAGLSSIPHDVIFRDYIHKLTGRSCRLQ